MQTSVYTEPQLNQTYRNYPKFLGVSILFFILFFFFLIQTLELCLAKFLTDQETEIVLFPTQQILSSIFFSYFNSK